MKSYSIIKYVICCEFEKLHRYVFDNLYICFEDKRYKPWTLKQKIINYIYKILFKMVYKDFREYPKLWHKKNKYQRYNDYFNY